VWVTAPHLNQLESIGYSTGVISWITIYDLEDRVMAKRGLSHIALKVRDLKKTEDFYVNVLGLKVAFRHPPSMIFLTTPGSGDLLNFVKTSQRQSANQGLEHLGFKVTSAELKKIESKINKLNIKIDGRRGKTAFYITDPNGFQLEYYCD